MSEVLGYLSLAGAVTLLVIAIALEIRLTARPTLRALQFRGVRFTTTAKE